MNLQYDIQYTLYYTHSLCLPPTAVDESGDHRLCRHVTSGRFSLNCHTRSLLSLWRGFTWDGRIPLPSENGRWQSWTPTPSGESSFGPMWSRNREETGVGSRSRSSIELVSSFWVGLLIEVFVLSELGDTFHYTLFETKTRPRCFCFYVFCFSLLFGPAFFSFSQEVEELKNFLQYFVFENCGFISSCHYKIEVILLFLTYI